jgi:hypothetical protein
MQDIRRNCSICCMPYLPGDEVLALDSLSYATTAMPCSPGSSSFEPSSKMILGHHGCVLPRLLTLLASFQPEVRFVKAIKDLSGEDSRSPERHRNNARESRVLASYLDGTHCCPETSNSA